MKQRKYNENVIRVPGKATNNGTAFVIGIRLNELATLSEIPFKGAQFFLILVFFLNPMMLLWGFEC